MYLIVNGFNASFAMQLFYLRNYVNVSIYNDFIAYYLDKFELSEHKTGKKFIIKIFISLRS